MIKRLSRWFCLYMTVAFVVLIFVMIYHAVVIHDLPKKALFFVIPAYAVLAGSFYAMFKILPAGYAARRQDHFDSSLKVAQIRVVRDSGRIDRLRAYQVIVDGKKVGEIFDGETRVFAVSPGRHQIRLKVDWFVSNLLELEVAEGDKATLHAKSNLQGRIWLFCRYVFFPYPRDRCLLIEHGTDLLPPKR